MRIATWNVNSLNVRLPHVLKWLDQQTTGGNAIDVLCLQELKLPDDKYPLTILSDAGYHSLFSGQKTYNGVAILIRKDCLWQNVNSTIKQIPGFTDPQQRVISTTLANTSTQIRIICAYFPNGYAPATEKFLYKITWLNALYNWLKQEIIEYPRLALLGDFNIAPKDSDVHNPAEWVGHNLVSSEERVAFQNLESLGLHDAFRLFPQKEAQFSWWDYRQGAFRRNAGMRIDHILLSNKLAQACQNCLIDEEPRRWTQPSD
ncbi:MAG: exodeoxyribonuclease III, partial [Ottowia sp.]|nr:exodeoxyribonuclease III [Ottowia sp.]